FGVAMLMTARGANKLIAQCWPIFALVGLAFASTLWSAAYPETFKKSYTLLNTVLFVMALAARYAPNDWMRLVLRVMAFECALSIVWVVIFPDAGIQQRTGLGASVEVGTYWRGVFSHKQGLGVFAGLTSGLLLFYGRAAFSSALAGIAALLC